MVNNHTCHCSIDWKKIRKAEQIGIQFSVIAGGQPLQVKRLVHCSGSFLFLFLFPSPPRDFTQENSTACHLENWPSHWLVDIGGHTLSHYKIAFAAGLRLTSPEDKANPIMLVQKAGDLPQREPVYTVKHTHFCL